MTKQSFEDMTLSTDPSERLWFMLLRLPNLMSRHGSTFFQKFGITPPQYFVLRRVYEGVPLTQQNLADRMGVSKGNISQMLKLMERDDLITRERDGVTKQILLTDKAHTLLKEIAPAHMEFAISKLSGLNLAEQGQLLALLGKLSEELE